MSGIANAIYNSFYALWNQITYAISNVRPFDVIDIIVVAFLIYKAFIFLRETRSGQLVKGIGVLIIVYGLAKWWNLAVLDWILSFVFNSAILVLAIIFQPELRRILERVGQTKLGVGRNTSFEGQEIIDCVETVGKSARIMSESKTGALIVFERKTQLGEIINTGTVINAKASVSLITNLFFPKAPLHDGAVIIRDGKVYAAGCILPLTSNNELSGSFGTRHRAAIGMTENSDAVVLVVSEETGNISIACNGEIKTGYNGITAVERLMGLLVTNSGQEDNKIFSSVKKAFAVSSQKTEKTEESEANDSE